MRHLRHPPLAGPIMLLALAAITLVCWVAWAQELPAAPVLEPHAPAPADAIEMVARLTTLPTAMEGLRLRATPDVWDRESMAARLFALAPSLERYDLNWGVSATVELPGGLGFAGMDVLCLSDPLQAFGVFTGLEVGDGIPAALGEGAQWAGNRLLIWQGPYVAIIEPDSPRVRVQAQVIALAQAVSAQLPLPDRKPLLVRLMPTVRMQRLTLVYWPGQVPDVPTLSRALSAQYSGEVGAARLVLADLGDETTARACYRQLLRELDPSGLHWPLPGLGGQNAVITVDGRSMAMLLQEGQYVAAVLEVTDRLLAEALLRITLTHIRIVRP